MLSRYFVKFFFSLLMLAFANLANAHLMPAQQGTINLVDNAAFVVLSLPVSGLVKFDASVDENGDGRLSEAELKVHRKTIEHYVKQGFQLINVDDLGTVDFLQISIEQDALDVNADSAMQAPTLGAGAKHFLLLMKISFKEIPMALRLKVKVFGLDESEKQFAIKVSRGKEIEAVVLRSHHPQHRFFRSATEVMGDYVITGVDHILTGFDHLLFLLTIIIAGAGWRYWFSVLTCFTIAHSITLTMTLMEMLRGPSAVIEPMIAFSIILMAVLNFYQREMAIRSRLVIVFFCGLLHGMGFASSIAEMGLHGSYFMASIVGFNLGIEVGQVIFLFCLLLVGFACDSIRQRMIFPSVDIVRWSRHLTSIFAMIAGAFLLQAHLLT